jgi:hypothetical protein
MALTRLKQRPGTCWGRLRLMISGGTRVISIGELGKIDRGAVAVAGRRENPASWEKPIIRMRERPFKMWQWYLNPSGKL